MMTGKEVRRFCSQPKCRHSCNDWWRFLIGYFAQSAGGCLSVDLCEKPALNDTITRVEILLELFHKESCHRGGQDRSGHLPVAVLRRSVSSFWRENLVTHPSIEQCTNLNEKEIVPQHQGSGAWVCYETKQKWLERVEKHSGIKESEEYIEGLDTEGFGIHKKCVHRRLSPTNHRRVWRDFSGLHQTNQSINPCTNSKKPHETMKRIRTVAGSEAERSFSAAASIFWSNSFTKSGFSFKQLSASS